MRYEPEEMQSGGARMRSLNWDDLRFVLAISRGRTLAAAGRRLGVDDTTVARRLAAVQSAIGGRLYQRLADGTLQLTSLGQRAALHAERMEREVGLLGAIRAGGDDPVSGTVRITSVPIVVNRMLLPAVPMLAKRHPALHLELIGDARDLSLTRREADLALRLARPRSGGTRVIARRIGALDYDIYVAAACPTPEARRLPWIAYDEAMAHLPQARWMAARIARNQEALAAVRVNDADAMVEAVACGLGRSLLPSAIADRDPRLKRHGTKIRPPVLSREAARRFEGPAQNRGRRELDRADRPIPQPRRPSATPPQDSTKSGWFSTGVKRSLGA
jgi:DNA-binding transcriptional LysR family regulator